MLSPLRYLAYQNLHRFKEYYKNKFNYILVSTDGTRNIDKITALIKKKNVISSTYDSCDVIIKILDKLKNVYIIVDEYHNLSHSNINDNNNDINKLIKSEHDKIFMSATPLEKFIDIPMDNIYKYIWNNAIDNGYICDFNIYIPNNEYAINDLMQLLNENYDEKEIKLIKKAYYIVKSMLMNGDKKCICYLTTIEKAEQFSKYLNWISEMLKIKLEHTQLDCTTKKLKRKEIINNFVNAINISIIVNVHILDEGIDILECDSVYITQPNNNMINIVQRMSRANRIIIGKNVCNVYLWTTAMKRGKIIKCIYDKTDGYIKDKVLINNVNNNAVNKYRIISEDNSDELTMQHLLKKHTDIDNKFIDIFFKEFKIDGDAGFNIKDADVAENLGIKLITLRHRLSNVYSKTIKYVENIDYIRVRTKNNITYLLNFQCFEKVVMGGDSVKSELARTYFSKLWSFIARHKNSPRPP
jgi:hypothetical protein